MFILLVRVHSLMLVIISKQMTSLVDVCVCSCVCCEKYKNNLAMILYREGGGGGGAYEQLLLSAKIKVA